MFVAELHRFHVRHFVIPQQLPCALVAFLMPFSIAVHNIFRFDRFREISKNFSAGGSNATSAVCTVLLLFHGITRVAHFTFFVFVRGSPNTYCVIEYSIILMFSKAENKFNTEWCVFVS